MERDRKKMGDVIISKQFKVQKTKCAAQAGFSSLVRRTGGRSKRAMSLILQPQMALLHLPAKGEEDRADSSFSFIFFSSTHLLAL